MDNIYEKIKAISLDIINNARGIIASTKYIDCNEIILEDTKEIEQGIKEIKEILKGEN